MVLWCDPNSACYCGKVGQQQAAFESQRNSGRGRKPGSRHPAFILNGVFLFFFPRTAGSSTQHFQLYDLCDCWRTGGGRTRGFALWRPSSASLTETPNVCGRSFTGTQTSAVGLSVSEGWRGAEGGVCTRFSSSEWEIWSWEPLWWMFHLLLSIERFQEASKWSFCFLF